MVTTFLAIGAAGAAHFAAPPITTLKGGIAVVQGTLNDTVSVDSAPHTINVTLPNGATQQVNNVLLVSGAFQFNRFQTGQPVTIVLNGSTPLLGSFSQNSVTVCESTSPWPQYSGRAIPMTSGGQLQASFMVPQWAPNAAITWNWPAFSLAGLNFVNGLTGHWNIYPSSYDLTIPNGAFTQQTVAFPTFGPKPLHVHFHATAQNTTYDIAGDGPISPLTVIGALGGTGSTTINSAVLDFLGGP